MKFIFIILFVIFCFFVQHPFAFIVLPLFLALYLFLNVEYRISKCSLLIIFIFTVCVFPAFLSFNHGMSPYFYYFSTVILFFSAKKMACERKEYLLKACKFSFYAYTFLMFFLYYIYRESAEPFGEVITGSSTNAIPSYLIVLQVTLSLLTYTVKGRLPLLSPLLTMVVAILGIGRGSILTASMIIFFSFFFNMVIEIKNRRYLFLGLGLLLLLILMALGVAYFDNFYEFLRDETNLSRGIYDPYRAALIFQYIGNITSFNLFSGAPYEGTLIDSMYAGNPHVAFIRTHAYLGLGGLMLVFLSPLYFFWMRGEVIHKIIFSTFIFILFFRALSEPILFPTLLDFFFFFIFWIYFFHINGTRKRKNEPL